MTVSIQEGPWRARDAVSFAMDGFVIATGNRLFGDYRALRCGVGAVDSLR